MHYISGILSGNYLLCRTAGDVFQVLAAFGRDISGFGSSVRLEPEAGNCPALSASGLGKDKRGFNCSFLPASVSGSSRLHFLRDAQAAAGESGLYYCAGGEGKGGNSSKALYKRLYAAEDYLKENPRTTAVLSGGQGPGETVTEARAMEQYLLSKGISKHRLRIEDKSTDTVENMKFSQAFLTDKNASAGVVTNDFHVYRGVAIGKKLGYTHIYGIPASSDMILQVNYLVRESFAVIKDKAAGNI